MSVDDSDQGMKAIGVEEFGRFGVVEVGLRDLSPGEVLVEVSYAAANYVDILYVRTTSSVKEGGLAGYPVK